MRRYATKALMNMARMRTPVLRPSFDSSFMRSSDSEWPVQGLQRVYRHGGGSALAKRGQEDGGGGDFVEGKIIGGAAGALLPVEEEGAVAVGEAGGGIDVELGQGAVDPCGGALQ